MKMLSTQHTIVWRKTMYQYRELIDVNDELPLDQQCQDIITNWEIVCEENDYHKDYVTPSQWDQWMSFRRRVDEKMSYLSSKNLGDIYDYLSWLNETISSAHRVNVVTEEKKKQIALQQERNAPPSSNLLNKLLFWR